MTFANKITIFRILSVPFFIVAMLYYTPQNDILRYVALAIFLFAIISDAIDGYIARTRKQKTQAGAILDPLADKILLITAFILLYLVSNRFFLIKLPIWFVIVTISRDMFLLLGGGIMIMTNQQNKIIPTRAGKLSTFFQMLTIVSLLLQLPLSIFVWSIAIVFTIISGVDYLKKGIELCYPQAQK